mmetsp:Transcript_6290/g.6575  ORF Transcript_6290/g.6575 Transcript_6290/m.6575 type:complete len:470 (-) Transcript_6290:98-1507(-)
MPKAKKYIFENGVMKLNPEYSKETGGAPVLPTQNQPLAIVSSMDDVGAATDAQATALGTSMQLAPSTIASLDIIQDDDYGSQFQAGTDGADLLEGLTNYFIQYEIPVGMLNKLMALQFYSLSFLIDDSGSMRAPTDTMMNEATIYLLRNGHTANPQQPMTRWQEAENRLHVMMDILAYIPTKQITITFFNAPNVISISRVGVTPEAFKATAHEQIIRAFSTIDVKYKTPTHRVLTKVFQEAAEFPDPTMHYLFTDGVPSDQPIEAVASLILHRQFPERNPLTLMSCTNEDEEVEWMKQIESTAPYCAEIDDYQDEKREVIYDQGPAFPYTKGFWIISQLVAAINPDDLDAMDENLPFSKYTLDDMLGRKHTPEEYQFYFERNPHFKLYLDLYPVFLNEERSSRSIVSQVDQLTREQNAGYINGERPNNNDNRNITGVLGTIFGGSQTHQDILQYLNKHTQDASVKFRQS